MNKKVKVNKEIAEAVEYVKSYNNFEMVLDIQLKKEWIDVRLQHLNKLSVEELAIALLVGYVVELTPEEKIKNLFNELDTSVKFDKGISVGIIQTLEYLNIKIKGVNE